MTGSADTADPEETPEGGRASASDDPDAGGPERRNVRLLLAYDGTEFRGFAASGDVRTVMGEFRAAIERVVRAPAELTGAGRTDAGVHGWGQVVSGQIPADTDLGRLVRSVNGLCAPDIVVRAADWAADDFDARFSATSRSYRYDVWNDHTPNPLLGRHVWHVPTELDVGAMNRAAEHFVGEHHFGSFCRRPKPGEGQRQPSLVRRITAAGWWRPDGTHLLRFEIAATAFCHQMVRSIVGTLVDVGVDRLSADSIPSILAADDRSAAGRVAPPTGLTLWHVGYDGPRWDTPHPQ